MTSLRKAINDNCKSCVVNPANAGNWKQQVTMCSCHDCAMYPVRPVSTADIPENILAAYSVPEWERSRFRGSNRGFFETYPPPNTLRGISGSKSVQDSEQALPEGNA